MKTTTQRIIVALCIIAAIFLLIKQTGDTPLQLGCTSSHKEAK